MRQGRGTVTELDVSQQPERFGSRQFRAGGNYIEIVHADCSFGPVRGPAQEQRLCQAWSACGGRAAHWADRRRQIRPRARRRDSAFYYKPGPRAKRPGSPETLPSPGNPGKGDEAAWAYIPLKFWTKKRTGKGMLRHGARLYQRTPHGDPYPGNKQNPRAAPEKKTKPRTKAVNYPMESTKRTIAVSRWYRLIPVAFITYSLALSRPCKFWVRHGRRHGKGPAHHGHHVIPGWASLFFLGYFFLPDPRSVLCLQQEAPRKLIFWSPHPLGALAPWPTGIISNVKDPDRHTLHARRSGERRLPFHADLIEQVVSSRRNARGPILS